MTNMSLLLAHLNLMAYSWNKRMVWLGILANPSITDFSDLWTHTLWCLYLILSALSAKLYCHLHIYLIRFSLLLILLITNNPILSLHPFSPSPTIPTMLSNLSYTQGKMTPTFWRSSSLKPVLDSWWYSK